jgi:hypothetical protein
MHYPFREEEVFDPQRMPGTRRATPPATPYIVHTREHPFCFDPLCSCHDNQEAITLVNSWVEQGLLTQAEAAEYIAGRTF